MGQMMGKLSWSGWVIRGGDGTDDGYAFWIWSGDRGWG